ncbi:MAG: hemolysin III family protein [Bacteroidota bacterium]
MNSPTIRFSEEYLNTYSHALGFALSVIGLFYFILFYGQSKLILPLLVYSGSLMLLFLASTLYHAVKRPVSKQRLRILDHISIYVLIAGSYTPVCVGLLSGSKGELLLYLVWGITLFGIVLKLFFTGKFEILSLLLYGVMGWLIVLDVGYLQKQLPEGGLLFLGLGGAFYTLGIFFYAMKRIPYNHFIWHLFVLGGALCHWVFMLNQVVVPNS